MSAENPSNHDWFTDSVSVDAFIISTSDFSLLSKQDSITIEDIYVVASSPIFGPCD